MPNNKTVVSVGIVSYKGWQDVGFPDTGIRKALMNILVETGVIQDPLLTDRATDGNRSLVQSYFDPQLNSNITIASYWKDSQIMDGYSHLAEKIKMEILSNLPKDENENILRSLAVKVLKQALNTSNVSAPLVTSASASTSSEKVALDIPVI
jgi:hypothetical protein